MKEAGMHFEQVPKSVVEKILAQQDGLLERDFEEKATSAKDAKDRRVFEPTLRPRKS